METSRDDIGIVVRSALLRKGAQQKFSLLALIILSIFLLFIETIESKPLNSIRSIFKDAIYRGSVVVSYPAKGTKNIFQSINSHINLYSEYNKLKGENEILRNQSYDPDFLKFENQQLRLLIEEQVKSKENLVSARVMLDKQSPYLNSFIINIGSNKGIKNGLAVLDGNIFIGRVVDVNYFSSRILLITDLNSKIPVIIEPKGFHAILSGTGEREPVLDFLPEGNTIESGNKIYTSGKEGLFEPGIPVGKVKIKEGKISVSLLSDISQISFININLGDSLKLQ